MARVFGNARRRFALLLTTLAASSTLTTLPASLLSAAEPITFNKHIAPLVFEHCAGCHHPGEVAPFSLLSYADASKRAKQIAEVTKSHFMPPWKSVAGHGTFVG